MAKVQIKSEKLTPFGGIFSIMEQFDTLLVQTIDSTLGLVLAAQTPYCVLSENWLVRTSPISLLLANPLISIQQTRWTAYWSKPCLLLVNWNPVKSMILDCVPPAESRPLFSSSSLLLRNGLRHHVGMYWTFTQTTMLMPTCSRQTLVKGHAFLVKPAYYLKSLYGVRGFCVYDVSVMPKEYVQ